jgi:2-dehydropantoate 2-reductase
VLGGVAVVSTQLDDNGDVRQLNDLASLTFGDQDGQRTEVVARAGGQLSGAGFPASASDDIVAAMWQKWAFIASAGALNCLLGGSVGEVVAVDGGDEIARGIVAETSSITGAAGYPLSDAALRQITTMLTAPGSSFTSSLYRDLREGKPVEVETILGDLVAEGRKAGVRTPLLDAATVALRVHNAAAAPR